MGGAFEKVSGEDYRKIIAVNLLGGVYGCQAFLPHLKAQGAGHIINISSLAAVTSPPNMAIYNATKSAVISLTETLYGELEGSGVDVSVAILSFFQSRLGDAMMKRDEKSRNIIKKLLLESTIRFRY